MSESTTGGRHYTVLHRQLRERQCPPELLHQFIRPFWQANSYNWARPLRWWQANISASAKRLCQHAKGAAWQRQRAQHRWRPAQLLFLGWTSSWTLKHPSEPCSVLWLTHGDDATNIKCSSYSHWSALDGEVWLSPSSESLLPSFKT